MSEEYKEVIFGEHTCIPSLTRADEKIHEKCNLTNSKGFLPPYMIVVGDRRRCVAASKLLENGVLLHDVMRDAGLNYGRINVAYGTYKGVPIVIAETQMGCPTVEINVKELLSSLSMKTDFTTSKGDHYQADARYVIRVGSCAGINPVAAIKGEITDKSTLIEGFDIVVCNKQVGVSGADVQSLTGKLNFLDARLPSLLTSKLTQLGYDIDAKTNMPSCPIDSELADTMVTTAKRLIAAKGASTRVFKLANVSKDSLYAEAQEEEFCELRDSFDVGSSEMEMATLTRLAQESKRDTPQNVVKVGMVCMTLGVIPGASFLFDKEREHAAQEVTIYTALEALAAVGNKHKTK